MAAVDAAAAMDVDGRPALALAADAPPAHALRSRLSGDVREKIGLPRTPALDEHPWRPDPALARPAVSRNCFDLARGGAFAMRAAAAAVVAESALEERLVAAASASQSQPMAVERDGAAEEPEAHDAPEYAPEVEDALGKLWVQLRDQVAQLATNPVYELAADNKPRVKLDKKGFPIDNNKLNERHMSAIIRALGEPHENPQEHAAMLHLLKAALACPCHKSATCDDICEALPCAQHTDWTRSFAGNRVFRAAKSRLAAVLPTRKALNSEKQVLVPPHHESMAPWIMNIITKAGTTLQLLPPFVRSLGMAALAAYGPAAFPCGMLSLGDPCVAHISTMCNEEADAPLLRELAAKAKAHADKEEREGRRPLTPAAARDLLARDLLELIDDRLAALSVADECGRPLDAAQRGMALAAVTSLCHGSAGPGAGKTRTLVARVAHMYRHRQGATPDRVVMVTFTNRSIEELKKRVLKARLPVPTRIVTLDAFVLTFLGSVCREAEVAPVALVSKDEQEAAAMGDQSGRGFKPKLLKKMVIEALVVRGDPEKACPKTKSLAEALTDELLKTMQRAGIYWSTADEALLTSVARTTLEQAAISWGKNDKTQASTVDPILLNATSRRQASYSVSEGNVAELLNLMKRVQGSLRQQEAKRASAGSACHLLCKHEAVLVAAALAAKARGKEPSDARQPPPAWAATPDMVSAATEVLARAHPTYYMLDEMQDTDPAQFELLAHLAKFRTSSLDARLTMVGDYDQAIYNFRGASPEALRAEIERFFPPSEPHLLVINYRSTPAIVAACSAIIAPSYFGAAVAPKALQAHRQTGLPVQLVACSSVKAEYERLLAEIDAWYAAGVALGKKADVGKGDGMAVIFWRNADAKAFAEFVRGQWSAPHNQHKQVALLSRDEKSDAAADADAPAPETPDAAAAAAAAAAAPPARGALHISTIHSVKGLEYEIVFLAGLGQMNDTSQSYTPKTWKSHASWVATTTVGGAAVAGPENRRMQFVGASRPRSLLHVSYAGRLEDACEAVAQLRAALGRNPPPSGTRLLQDLSCGEGQAAALAAQPGFERTVLALMGEEED